jgi:hypothetical protein
LKQTEEGCSRTALSPRQKHSEKDAMPTHRSELLALDAGFINELLLVLLQHGCLGRDDVLPPCGLPRLSLSANLLRGLHTGEQSLKQRQHTQHATGGVNRKYKHEVSFMATRGTVVTTSHASAHAHAACVASNPGFSCVKATVLANAPAQGGRPGIPPLLLLLPFSPLESALPSSSSEGGLHANTRNSALS